MGMTLNLDFLKKLQPLFKRSKSGSSTVSLYNPGSSTYYELNKNGIKATTKLTQNSKLISFIQLDDITSETIEMSGFLEGEELHDAIEMKLFEDLALEPGLEYKICYNEHVGANSENGETKKYNAYVCPNHTIKQKLSQIEHGYVDFVFLPQTTIKTLFNKNFLSDSSTFAFIYLYNDSAYLCVYQNGEYTYSKSIRGSIRTLTERFSEILGERVDGADFIKILTNASFRTKKPEYEAGFSSLLSEFFTSISDVLVHAKRINQIGGYEAIYIATEHGNIADIEVVAKEYFETPFKNFDFNLGIKTEDFVDMSTRLMLFAYLNDIDAYENINFSIFMRPPPLFKRPAGKFMGISTVALLVSFSYPLYNVTLAKLYYTFQTNSLNKELAKLKTEQSVIENQRAALQKEQEMLGKKNSDELKKYTDTVKILQELEEKRLSANSVTGYITQIDRVAANSRVSLRKVDTNTTGTKIECSGNDAASISRFSKNLWLSNGFKTSTDKITKEQDAKKLIGQISVEVSKK
jgi:cell division protein FtsB